MTRAFLRAFFSRQRYAVQASTAATGNAQAAVIGIAVSDQLEIVFDTIETTRKARNLARDPRIALVVGGLRDGEAETVQYEGIADRPAGEELEALRDLYFSVFPDGRGRLHWPGLIHVRVRPTWLRYSDFRNDPPTIVELDSAAIAALARG